VPALGFVLALSLVLAQTTPVFVVAVRYGAADRPAWERDLPAIRSLGFTAIVVPDERVESIRGVASQQDLIVIPERNQAAPPVVLLDVATGPGSPRYVGWAAVQDGARVIAFAVDGSARSRSLLEAGAFASVVSSNARLFLAIKPVEGARADGSTVEARLFKAGHALVLIALNHSDEPRDATIALPEGSPLAEWVNLETGEVAYFDRAPGGVSRRHRFAPRDALVLVIRKDIQ
jgi:hypothetical protein